MCKAACQALADQSTKQNCVDYWTTGWFSQCTYDCVYRFIRDKRIARVNVSDVRLLKRRLQSHAKRSRPFSSRSAISAIATTQPLTASPMPVWLGRRRRVSSMPPSIATQSAKCARQRTSAIVAPRAWAIAWCQSNATGPRHRSKSSVWLDKDKQTAQMKNTLWKNIWIKQNETITLTTPFLSPSFYKFVNAKIQ